MKKMIVTLIAVFGLVGGVYGFIQHRAQSKQQQTNQQTKLRVVTTNSILEDMVHNVGQDHIELYSIVKRGTDPHEYEPQPTDISKATDADVIFHNGLNLETGGNGWFRKLVKIAHKQFEKDVFAASKGIQVQHLTTNQTEPDPHAWLDLANGIQYVENITKALQTKDPAHADDYRKNADRYTARLRKLHTDAQTKFADIPANQRVLVTSEGAFKYFGKAYQVTPVYIWEINTESQGTPEQMKTVLAKIADSDVKHLFVESSVSPKSMEKVAQETGLPIYAKIFTDSLAQRGKQGDTYYTMMKWNLDKIHDGLVGQ
ncbi:metal ABC transporter substrate-binding protein [Latilactobacillus curvatus]|uniref:Metal ABC transporter substrate-binding protein n=2 Tax=Latilactobacillus curvatus TaxID=28038 RepID=A0A1X7QMT7_LATCU|nr:metal ABC transporter substrate-binding protein [Latilactobacillus curvatus]AOO76219.1 manganese ABC transporter substrate-binding protein [Latilactobacillus curvatus]AWV73670.1 metal ABC transporter substrate-binding protein [Latilactobacillus curvatus]AXN36659.1 metal ABC transporter substrate-binding protein [Latilactobacillus curvatus]KRK92962.1 manganese ABC transporter substrate-binding lipoprotein [Latilactobacillus curvatus JCM 1096 = DSM 20019]MBZ1505243.1 metal ABC transporter sub